MEDQELDPGAVKYGNFKNYYSFNAVEKRLELIPFDVLPKKRPFYALDIGCNSGDLTSALYKKICADMGNDVHILGIDLDEELIRLAQSKATGGLQFQQADVMQLDGRNSIKQYRDDHSIKKFDVIFGFSITLWIHLNHCDDGLKEFLEYIYSISDMVLIEPQKWKSYRTANRRLRRNNIEEFANLSKLKLRHKVDEEIERYLMNLGGEVLRKTKETHWGRNIFVVKCS